MITDKFLCGLDIGSKHIKASFAKYKRRGGLELIAIHESRTQGLSAASVRDLKELSDCIHETMRALFKRTGKKTKDLQLGISGHFMIPRHSSTIIPLLDRGSKVISRRDVKKANHQACLLGVNMEEQIIHRFAQSYLVDDVTSTVNPVGLHGRRLETNFLLIIANINLINNIKKAVNQAGFEVQNLYFSSLAGAQASLHDKAKNKGCVLVDVGASATNILFFKEGKLKQLNILPVGGNELTSGVAEQLNLPFDLAEDIKKSYAVAFDERIDRDKEVLIKREKAYKPIKRGVINAAVEPKVSELVRGIQETLTVSSVFQEISEGMIMIGGGALLPGLMEYVEKELNIPVRMGKVNIELTRLNNPAIYASCVGLTQLTAAAYNGFPLSPDNSRDLKGTMVERITEFYQEYF